MSSISALKSWREELDRTHARTLESVTEALAAAETQGREAGARDAAEQLNQIVRRLRRTTAESDVLAVIVSSSAPFCGMAADFMCEGEQARLLHARGFEASEMAIEMKNAAAFWSAVETKDPVVTSATAKELSPEFSRIAAAHAHDDERVYLFPVVVRGAAVAILFAAGNAQPPALELLCEAAASHIESLRPVVETRAETRDNSVKSWKDLAPDEQAVHLRAQRFARLKVAEMRLARPAAVRQGVERADIYSALKGDIDAAREAYRREFLGTSHTMVDYLYIELLRNFANDDDRLLGPGFPGALV